jgi:hypothetical protein
MAMKGRRQLEMPTMPMQTAAGPPAGHPPRAPNPAPATVIAPAWGEMPTTGFWRLGSSDGLGSALKCDRISLALRRAPQSHPQNIRVWTDRPPRFGFGPDVRVDMSNTGRAISSSSSRRNRAAAFSAADVPRGQPGCAEASAGVIAGYASNPRLALAAPSLRPSSRAGRRATASAPTWSAGPSSACTRS